MDVLVNVRSLGFSAGFLTSLSQPEPMGTGAVFLAGKQQIICVCTLNSSAFRFGRIIQYALQVVLPGFGTLILWLIKHSVARGTPKTNPAITKALVALDYWLPKMGARDTKRADEACKFVEETLAHVKGAITITMLGSDPKSKPSECGASEGGDSEKRPVDEQQDVADIGPSSGDDSQEKPKSAEGDPPPRLIPGLDKFSPAVQKAGLDLASSYCELAAEYEAACEAPDATAREDELYELDKKRTAAVQGATSDVVAAAISQLIDDGKTDDANELFMHTIGSQSVAVFKALSPESRREVAGDYKYIFWNYVVALEMSDILWLLIEGITPEAAMDLLLNIVRIDQFSVVKFYEKIPDKRRREMALSVRLDAITDAMLSIGEKSLSFRQFILDIITLCGLPEVANAVAKRDDRICRMLVQECPELARKMVKLAFPVDKLPRAPANSEVVTDLKEFRKIMQGDETNLGHTFNSRDFSALDVSECARIVVHEHKVDPVLGAIAKTPTEWGYQLADRIFSSLNTAQSPICMGGQYVNWMCANGNLDVVNAFFFGGDNDWGRHSIMDAFGMFAPDSRKIADFLLRLLNSPTKPSHISTLIAESLSTWARRDGSYIVIVHEVLNVMHETMDHDDQWKDIARGIFGLNPHLFILCFTHMDNDQLVKNYVNAEASRRPSDKSLWPSGEDHLANVLEAVASCPNLREIFFEYVRGRFEKIPSISDEERWDFFILAAQNGFEDELVARFGTSVIPRAGFIDDLNVDIDRLLRLLSKEEVREKVGKAAAWLLSSALKDVRSRAVIVSRLPEIREVLSGEEFPKFAKCLLHLWRNRFGYDDESLPALSQYDRDDVEEAMEPDDEELR
ncbi:MAG: hypothetical protein LBF26_03660 [Puniceicoccales bacterium]|nr:hypothetical protein [Puniceicoccales bacterium]